MPASPLDVARARESFPVTRSVYFNHAFFGPPPVEVVSRMNFAMTESSTRGGLCWPGRKEETARVRSLAARLLSARHAHEIAFQASTTDALSAVANGVAWRDGDVVVGVEGEFPANSYPWIRLSPRGVTFRRVAGSGGVVTTDDVIAAIDDRTRAVAVSWVDWVTGHRLDLERIGGVCRERGVLFAVDAIQGLGVLEIDVERDKVDVLAAGVHKWMHGPEGLALLYVSDRVVDAIAPAQLGQRSLRRGSPDEALESMVLADGALRFESSTLNAPGIFGLGAAIDLLLGYGPRAIEERALHLAELLCGGLADAGYDVSPPGAKRSAIVSAAHPATPADVLQRRLHERRVIASERGGRLRLSPNFYNTEDEVRFVFEVLAHG